MSGQPAEPQPPPRSREFTLSHTQMTPDAIVVEVQGDLDLSSAPALKWGLADLLRSGTKVVVLDMAGVSFMDSTAIGVLVGIERTLGPDQRLALVRLRQEVAKVFEITGLEDSFEIFTDVDHALAPPGDARPEGQASSG